MPKVRTHHGRVLDDDLCYEAIRRRDPGADGVFFVAVLTTGIYCRPICPARLPLRRNVTFYRTATAAREGGFRPCLRCRPESAPDSPAWVGSLATINRALRLIDEGRLVEESLESLAGRLGMTGRHLRRLFDKHVGVSPLAIEQTRRIHLAKKLIHETRLPMTQVAFAAGYGSVRRFNEAFVALFGRSPSNLRRRGAIYDAAAPVTVSIAYRPPLDWERRLAEAPCIGGVIVGSSLSILLPFQDSVAQVALTPSSSNKLTAELTGVPIRALGEAIVRTKQLIFSELYERGTADPCAQRSMSLRDQREAQDDREHSDNPYGIERLPKTESRLGHERTTFECY